MATESFPAVGVFKVPHHGANSGYYAPFFDRVHPANSVISVGPNSYGHPSASVIAALAAFGPVYRTDTNGDITVTETANSLQVTPAASAPAPTPAAQASPAPAPASGPFVGSVNSNIYHYPSCPWAQKIKPQNLITFSSAQDAVNHGYRPCNVCNPPLPEKFCATSVLDMSIQHMRRHPWTITGIIVPIRIGRVDEIITV